MNKEDYVNDGELIKEGLERKINEVVWLAKVDKDSFFYSKIYFQQI